MRLREIATYCFPSYVWLLLCPAAPMAATITSLPILPLHPVIAPVLSMGLCRRLPGHRLYREDTCAVSIETKLLRGVILAVKERPPLCQNRGKGSACEGLGLYHCRFPVLGLIQKIDTLLPLAADKGIEKQPKSVSIRHAPRPPLPPSCGKQPQAGRALSPLRIAYVVSNPCHGFAAELRLRLWGAFLVVWQP